MGVGVGEEGGGAKSFLLKDDKTDPFFGETMTGQQLFSRKK